MTRKAITATLLGISIAAILGWDLYLAILRDWDSTVSDIVFHLSAHRMIPFIVGLVCGHFFWPIQGESGQ